MNTGPWRYFYFKNGDAVAQLRRIVSLGAAPDGGPDAFLADFLKHAGVAAAQVACFTDGERRERHGAATGRSYSRQAPLARLKSLLALPAHILAFRPDRILCGRQGYALAACLAAGRLLGVPVVFSAHNRIFGQARGWHGRLRERLDAWLIRRCRGAICHGPYLARELADIGLPQTRLQVFDSGCADLVEAAAPPARVDDRRTILYLGRMVRDKGIFDLIEAFQLICAVDGATELVFVGDGPDRAELQALAGERGLAGRVQFRGQLPHGRVAEEIRRSWTMVTPTRSDFPEGRCMAAMEALALGVPVIAPDDGPFPYLVAHGVNGLLFRQDSAASLAAALSRLLSEPGLRAHLAGGALARRGALLKPERGFAEAVLQAFQPSAAGA